MMRNAPLFLLLALGLLVACQPGGLPPGPSATAVTVTADLAALAPGGSTNLTAEVEGAGPAVDWSIVSGGGALSDVTDTTATYTAPAVSADATVEVRATSRAGGRTSAATLRVLAGAAALTASVVAVPGSSASDLVLVSPLAEGAAGESTGAARFTVPADRAATVAAIDPARGFGWTAVWPAWFKAEGAASSASTAEHMGPLSTAVQMVFALPGVHHTDPTEARRIVGALRSLPELGALAAALGRHAGGADPLNAPEVVSAFRAAIAAAKPALDALPPRAAPGGVGTAVRPAAAPSYTPLDRFATDLAVTASRVEPRWDSGYPAAGRTLSWVARVYRVDTARYDGAQALSGLWRQDPWRTDVALGQPSMVGQTVLPADPFWAGLAERIAKCITDGCRLREATGVDLPDPNAAYAVHLYTCSFGALDPSTAADRRLITGWSGQDARDGWGRACLQNILEFGVDLAGLYFDATALFDEGFATRVVDEVFLTLAPELARGSLEQDKALELVSLTLRKLGEYALEKGVQGGLLGGTQALLGMVGKNLLNSVSVLTKVGKIGSRIGAAVALSPWEGYWTVLGNPSWGQSRPDPPGTEQATTFAAGNAHSLAVKTDGTLWAWGHNYYGQLGDGTAMSRSTPIQVMADVKAVAAGWDHTLAVKTDGTLWAWGRNFFGSLGDGTTKDSSEPVRVMEGIKAVAAGNQHSLAVKTDGTLWAWGHNIAGQLGDGTTTGRSRPVRVMADVKAVAAHEFSSLAVAANGTLWAWGQNVSGELGDGSATDRSRPVRVMADVKAVAAGALHSLAVKTDGSLWTWGSNFDGQLGDGSATSRPTPVQVMGGVEAVAAGWAHSLAMTTDGTLWAWGRNISGALGDGTAMSRSTPVQVMADVKAVAAGNNHSLAVKTDGTLWAWGENGSGALGDGTTTDRSRPVRILLGVTPTR